MLFWTIVKVGLKSLWGAKLRSFLAMLGIIIGVGAVIAMLAIGAGTRNSILSRVSAMGTNLLVIRPGQAGTGGVMSGTSQSLTVADAQAILNEVAGVQRVAPLVNGMAQLKRMGKNSRVSIQGTTPTWMLIRDFTVDKGRLFNDTEIDSLSRVAVLGPTTVTNLFGEDDPLGQMVKVNGINFKVVGVTKEKGDQGFYNPDDQIIIPYTVAMKQLFGVDYVREIDVQAAEASQMKQVQDDITTLLRRRHRTAPGAENDFDVRNQADLLATLNQFSQTLTWLLGGIASISLLVGGIGIMNIMLVTVTERTREIGIRKAIGAKSHSILMQFLIESMIMSGLGGSIGAGAGVGAAAIMAAYSPFKTSVEMFSVVLAMGFASAVGIVFGVYPAWRAAKLDPVEALRYE